MELKKNKKYDLEHKRPLFFGIGMIISLSLVLVAFEWKSPVDPVVDLTDSQMIVCQFDVPLPEKNETSPPLTKWLQSGSVITNDHSFLSDPIDFKELKDSITVTSCGLPIESTIKRRIRENEVYTIAETMPSYPGGYDRLKTELQSNLKYPEQAARFGIEGRVFVQFVVEKDGSLTGLRVVKGIGAGCDEEALRVMKLVPDFLPGKQGDVRVRVQMIIPINFTLQ